MHLKESRIERKLCFISKFETTIGVMTESSTGFEVEPPGRDGLLTMVRVVL